MMPLFLLALAFFAFQPPAAREPTPEEACGPVYHEFSPPIPAPRHRPRVTLESLASSETLVEGTVVSKKTYARGGVENDIQFRVTKALKGAGITKNDVITIHVNGGYAGDDRNGFICLWDDQSDGMCVKVGKIYLVSATWDMDNNYYRSDLVASWFLIAMDGDLIPLTRSLVYDKALAGKKIGDLEQLIDEPRRTRT